MKGKKKIGIVVQRYGEAVNGGAEAHARMIAEHLESAYDVTVLTSRAIDYKDWKPEYPAGESEENGIQIIRFENATRGARQNYYSKRLKEKQPLQILFRLFGRPRWFSLAFPKVTVTEEDGWRWLEEQGPAMPQLIHYLKTHEAQYTAFIVFTALYYPGALSVLTVPQKTIFIPTIHDESASYFPVYKKIMAAPAWIFFNSKAEKKFSEKLFPIEHIQKRIVGVGIEPVKDRIVKNNSILQQYGITSKYIVYVGRINKAKGCGLLINYFLRFVKQTNAALQLVMVGKEAIAVPNHPNIVRTGFADDGVKQQLMLQAEALVMPSLYESLSLVLLESFACGVPVIANWKTEVLRDHINASNGGWSFTDYDQFAKALTDIINGAGVKEKGAAGYQYVKEHYSWEKIMSCFHEAIEDIEQRARPV